MAELSKEKTFTLNNFSILMPFNIEFNNVQYRLSATFQSSPNPAASVSIAALWYRQRLTRATAPR